FTEPDFLAPFLVGSFLLILPFWGKKRVGAWTPVVYFVVPLLLAASMLSMVRASWLGMFAGLAAFGWLKLRERGDRPDFGGWFKRMAGIAAAVAVIAMGLAVLWPAAFSTVSVRAKNMLTIVEPENPHATRLNEMTQTWNVIKENPLIGHGVGTFSVSTKYGQGVAATSGHRAGVVGAGTPLSLLHDQGIGGLLAFALVLGVLLWRLVRASRTAGAVSSPYVQGVFACVVGLTASACFNNLYYFGYYWLIIALAAAFAEPLWPAGRRSEETPETAR
ncbi:MAG TPA: O-antigen ligase family protein, partial [Dehalococcoidia bacterium]|nr:O-antigen ligase family protein [Dehalococcoidia bacterium]